MEVLREGYAIPFRMPPTPIILDSYSPQSVKGRALDEEIQALRRKGAVEPAPPTPGFFSRMFVVTKATGGLAADHRPVHPEPECGSDPFSDGDISDGSARCSQERLDGLHISEGCLPSDPDPPCVSQVPQVHSRREDLAVPGPLLRSVHSPTGVHSCDGTCVRIPPSAGNPDASVSGRLADSRVISGGSLLGKGQGSQPLSGAGNRCQLRESTLTPSQTIVYLGIRIDSQTFRVSATPSRIEKFFSIAEEFLSSKVQSAKFWRVLLGHLASLSRLVPNGQFRMRALQLALSRGWDFRDEDILVPWDPPSRDDLQWWCTEGRLEEGISLALSSPDQMFWSDASNLGWGATVADQFASGVWLEGEVSLYQPTRVVGRRERPQGSLFLFGMSGCRSLL